MKSVQDFVLNAGATDLTPRHHSSNGGGIKIIFEFPNITSLTNTVTFKTVLKSGLQELNVFSTDYLLQLF